MEEDMRVILKMICQMAMGLLFIQMDWFIKDFGKMDWSMERVMRYLVIKKREVNGRKENSNFGIEFLL